MTALRLLSLNIDGRQAPWRARKAAIRQLLTEESADLVALQEVLRPDGAGASQADELGEGLGYRAAFGPVHRLQRPVACAVGHAVLSRFPLREQRSELLPGSDEAGEPQGLLYVLYSVKVGLLPLVVTSLAPLSPSLRQTQREHLARYLATERAELPSRVPPHVAILPALLCGDLGDGPTTSERQQLQGAAKWVASRRRQLDAVGLSALVCDLEL